LRRPHVRTPKKIGPNTIEQAGEGGRLGRGHMARTIRRHENAKTSDRLAAQIQNGGKGKIIGGKKTRTEGERGLGWRRGKKFGGRKTVEKNKTGTQRQ